MLVRCTTRFYSWIPPFLLYVNDIPQSLSEADSYLYVEDTCIFYEHKDVNKI